MIKLTEAAAKEVLRVFEGYRRGKAEGGAASGETEPTELYLRVAVKGGGCTGFEQTLDLADTVGENDEVFEQHGVKVICDPKSHIYLDGSTLDFETSGVNSRFLFDIPLATGRCGCGASFSV